MNFERLFIFSENFMVFAKFIKNVLGLILLVSGSCLEYQVKRKDDTKLGSRQREEQLLSNVNIKSEGCKNALRTLIVFEHESYQDVFSINGLGFEPQRGVPAAEGREDSGLREADAQQVQLQDNHLRPWLPIR